jgi:hypothetical protein
MTDSLLLRRIEQQLDNLQSLNQMQFDYWLSQICDEDDELIPEKCSQEVLNLILHDVYVNS